MGVRHVCVAMATRALRHPPSRRLRRNDAGFSLVELMVSLSIGLVIVGGAIHLLAAHLDGMRRLLLGARIQQDLQVTADLVIRGLRRQGYVAPDASSVQWRLSQGAVQMKWDDGGWQSVTDAETMLVTQFALTTTPSWLPMGGLCTPACAASDPACLRVGQHAVELLITARASSDPSLQRQVRDSVQIRNDEVAGACV
jgi:prepilin-type N-terminal cleavage/methylation domain-containing protein